MLCLKLVSVIAAAVVGPDGVQAARNSGDEVVLHSASASAAAEGAAKAAVPPLVPALVVPTGEVWNLVSWQNGALDNNGWDHIERWELTNTKTVIGDLMSPHAKYFGAGRDLQASAKVYVKNWVMEDKPISITLGAHSFFSINPLEYMRTWVEAIGPGGTFHFKSDRIATASFGWRVYKMPGKQLVLAGGTDGYYEDYSFWASKAEAKSNSTTPLVTLKAMPLDEYKAKAQANARGKPAIARFQAQAQAGVDVGAVMCLIYAISTREDWATNANGAGGGGM